MINNHEHFKVCMITSNVLELKSKSLKECVWDDAAFLTMCWHFSIFHFANIEILFSNNMRQNSFVLRRILCLWVGHKKSLWESSMAILTKSVQESFGLLVNWCRIYTVSMIDVMKLNSISENDWQTLSLKTFQGGKIDIFGPTNSGS